MSIKLVINNVKPYKEVSPEIDGKKSTVSFGIKQYEVSELAQVREDFRNLAVNTELELTLARVTKLEEEGDKTEQDFYDTRENLRKVINSLVKQQEEASIAFYKSQILFVRNASISIEEDGVSKSIQIADTSKASRVESLWNTPDECLVVLLDAYFENTSIRDSLITSISNIIFNISSEAKVKN